MSKPAALIVWNRESGITQNALNIEACLTEAAQSYDLQYAEVRDILQPDNVRRKFPINRCTHLIAIGGDGTISAAANIAVLFKLTLLVVPNGTFNHFAVHLGIPRDISKAFSLLASGHRSNIDVGRVNDRVFINFISLGYYTDIIRSRLAVQRQGGMKWTSFLKALGKETLKRKRHTLVFSTSEKTNVSKETPLLFIGNGEFEFGSRDILAGRKSFTSNKVHLAIFKDYTRIRLFFIALASMMFDTTKWFSIENYKLTTCTITDPHHQNIQVALDGEIVTMQGELSVSSLPQALRIILPKETTLR